jgi:hypothetical protein
MYQADIALTSDDCKTSKSRSVCLICNCLFAQCALPHANVYLVVAGGHSSGIFLYPLILVGLQLCSARCTCFVLHAAQRCYSNFCSYCNGSRALYVQSAQVRQASALFANIFSRCSAVRSCIMPQLLIKRLCRFVMPIPKARCPRCNVFTHSRNCF